MITLITASAVVNGLGIIAWPNEFYATNRAYNNFIIHVDITITGVAEKYKFQWDEINQRTLISFFASETGSKLLARWKILLGEIVNEAMNAKDKDASWSYMSAAKGMAMLIQSVDQRIEPFEEPREKEEEKQVDAYFARIISRPAMFK